MFGPNITGGFWVKSSLNAGQNSQFRIEAYGAFQSYHARMYITSVSGSALSSDTDLDDATFSAEKSNATYGAATMVQPASAQILMIIKV